MKVFVKWLKSPLRHYGLPYGLPGGGNWIPVDLAKKIESERPDMIVVDWPKEKPVKVKDTQARKPRTRPVTREKKD
jgi:hypothetical protein